MNTHFLYPGQLNAFRDETLITTILGSCVAVTIYDPIHKVGGINHFLLDSPTEYDDKGPRYGSFAIPELIRRCEELGGKRANFQARLFGGANVVEISIGGASVGERNIALAEKVLQELGIPVLEKDVGGQNPRTIRFNSATGKVAFSRGE